jgi:hypothetical protein
MSAELTDTAMQLVEQYTALLGQFKADTTIDRVGLSRRLEELHQLLVRMNLDHPVPDVMER